MNSRICTSARWLRPILVAVSITGLGVFPLPAAAAYLQTNLVSDVSAVATYTDPYLQNPWGMSYSPTSPIWVSDNNAGVATLYNGDGTPQSLVVTIPPATSSPTGQVFNPDTTKFAGARFLFATGSGTIAGWDSGTSATLKVDNSGIGAGYTGLAIGSTGSGAFLYGANFSQGKIDIFDTNFAAATLAGSFIDPNLPSGYAPFNIQNLGGTLYVTYATQTGGPGQGIVDAFDLNGNLLKRVITYGTLNSPWGLALAPADFGEFSNALLVGNHGDGLINAFNSSTGAWIGSLNDIGGNPIEIFGLWGLLFGNGGNGGDLNKLYFTAGVDEVAGIATNGIAQTYSGLFGSLSSLSRVPEPGTLALFGLGLAGLRAVRRKRLAA
jgi:uncharacterized protein (TIGR03118 family)